MVDIWAGEIFSKFHQGFMRYATVTNSVHVAFEIPIRLPLKMRNRILLSTRRLIEVDIRAKHFHNQASGSRDKEIVDSVYLTFDF